MSIPRFLVEQMIAYGIFLFIIFFPFKAFSQNTNLTEMVNYARAQGIDPNLLNDLQKRAKSNGLSDEQLVQIINPAVDLLKESLPSQIILQKALEGLSKGVSPDRMIPILRNMSIATQKAGPVVELWLKHQKLKNMMQSSEGKISNKALRNGLIKAVSKGVRKGMTEKEFSDFLDDIETEGLLSKTDPGSIIAATEIFSDVNSSFKKSKAAQKFIITSLKAGFKAHELQKLPVAMEMAKRRSQLPAKKVIESVSYQLNTGVPAKQILQNLFNGNVGGGPPGGIPPGLEKKRNNNGNKHGRGNNNRGNTGRNSNGNGNNGRGH